MSIICGTDLSDAGAAATAAAIAIGSLRGDDEVVVAHVIDVDAEDDAARTKLAAEARVKLEEIAARARIGFNVAVRHEIVFGPAVASLTSIADTEGADLIVVGSLGETAEKVIAASAVPVLVVRTAEPFIAWARGARPLRVLVGIDDSLSSDAAIAIVKSLRAKSAIDVVLGTVYYADEAARSFGLPVSSAVDANPEVERLLARDLMRRFGVTTGAGTVTAKPVRGLGRIGDHMIELADAEGADVVLVGTHQKTGIGRLGSVSAVVAHGAKQSVLCVPPTTALGRPDVPRLTIAVVGTDLSAFANRAVPYAYSLAGTSGEVHIVHVREDDPGDQRQLVEQQLLALTPTGNIAATTAHVLVGDDPAELIAETAARVGADVICVASHGRSGFTRALVGSVADRLMRHTRLPVLVLRPKM